MHNSEKDNVYSLWTLALILCVSMVLLAGCGNSSSGPQGSNEIWGQSDAKQTDMISKIPGYVDKMLVQEGESVKKGQLLARIASNGIDAKKEQVQAKLSAARAKESQARAGLLLAEKDLQRYRELYEAGAISEQNYDQAVTKYTVSQETYREAQAGVAAYEKGVQEVQSNLDDTDIKAPMDGIIATKYVNEGALVSTGMPIYNVQSTTNNWVNFKVPETVLGHFKLGQKVKVQGRNNNLTLEGTIVEISKKPDFATQRATSERGNAGDIISFNVKVQLNDSHVFPGMRFKLLGYTLDGGKEK